MSRSPPASSGDGVHISRIVDKNAGTWLIVRCDVCHRSAAVAIDGSTPDDDVSVIRLDGCIHWERRVGAQRQARIGDTSERE